MYREISKTLFGSWSRYQLIEAIDRFGDKVWLVTDAMVEDDVTGRPAVIRQESTREAAMAGLEDDED